MGLRDFLKKHETNDDDGWSNDSDDEEGTVIDVGGMIKAIRDRKKRKS